MEQNEIRIKSLKALEKQGLLIRLPGGGELTITSQDVIEFLTQGIGRASLQEAVFFLAYCAVQGLNPIQDEAYLIKYDVKEPAQIVLGKQGYLKLAQRSPEFIQARNGVIVKQNGKLVHRDSLFYDKEKEVLVGGWAEVHRKDKPLPYTKEVVLEEYDRHMALWKTKPATMIAKVALVQALREAFPDTGISSALAKEDIEGEFEEVDEEELKRKRFWAVAGKLGYNKDEAHQILGVSSLKDWLAQGKTYDEALDILRRKKIGEEKKPIGEAKYKNYGEVAMWAYQTYNHPSLQILADLKVKHWEELGTPDEAARAIESLYGVKSASQ